MRILLQGESQLTLSDFHLPGFFVEQAEGVHAHFSALQMFVTAVALCTASVLRGYGEQLKVGSEGLQVQLRFRVVERPRRLDDLEMDIRWPELPESRLKAAERAAAQCTLHNTLHQPPRMRTTVGR